MTSRGAYRSTRRANRRERRRRIVRRQEHAARREGRAFFEMQIGDDE